MNGYVLGMKAVIDASLWAFSLIEKGSYMCVWVYDIMLLSFYFSSFTKLELVMIYCCYVVKMHDHVSTIKHHWYNNWNFLEAAWSCCFSPLSLSS